MKAKIFLAVMILFFALAMAFILLLNKRAANVSKLVVEPLHQETSTLEPVHDSGLGLRILTDPELVDYFMWLINEERINYGLSSVILDDLAAKTGQAHAAEMAGNGYMSHWNQSGFGPDIRYSLAGGTEWVQENVYSSWQRYDNGTPVPIEDWNSVIKQAHEALMNSPGHRANILNPDHTHVGIGLAYDPKTGEFRVAQEFINRYVELDTMPDQARPGSEITISFRLLNDAAEPVVNLAYEPFPQPLSTDQLNGTSTYSSPAEYVGYFGAEAQSDGSYLAKVKLGNTPGLYHIRIWVKLGAESPQAVDWVAWVK